MDEPLSMDQIRKGVQLSDEERSALAGLVQSNVWKDIVVGKIIDYCRRAIITGLLSPQGDHKFSQGQYSGVIMVEDAIQRFSVPVRAPEVDVEALESQLYPTTNRSY